MRRSCLVVLPAAALVAIAVPASSHAAVRGPAWRAALARVERKVAPARAEVSTIRSLAAEGSVFSMVRGVALAVGHLDSIRRSWPRATAWRRTPRARRASARSARSSTSGGSDSYSSSAASTLTSDGVAAAGPLTQSAQGGVDAGQEGLGLAVDLDGVGTDTYSVTPADPACQGVRGQAVWMDCGTVGLGVNA